MDQRWRADRRNVKMTSRGKAIGMALFAALVWFGGAGASHAASAGEINRDVTVTLDRLYRQIPGTRDLGARAFGILVFPTIIKAGWGIGGEYGEGALRVQGRTVGYFNTVSASIGLQFGAQARSVVIMFMTPDALDGFRRVDGWKIGVDGSVAIITVGAGGSVDSDKVASPVVGFILDPKGLMYNLTLEGTKISRMHR
jgi:lipid-binding SYLF domain-containing protein